MELTRLEQQIRFIVEIDKLKTIRRRTYVIDEARNENTAEHSWHIAVMAMLLAEHANEKIDISKVVYLEGPAGSVTIHNCRTLHHSKANWSEIPRPLLLHVYSASDAMPYTHNPLPSKYYGAHVRGKPARWAYHDPRPCLLPPDWSGGYTSIFAVQQEEDWSRDHSAAAVTN